MCLLQGVLAECAVVSLRLLLVEAALWVRACALRAGLNRAHAAKTAVTYLVLAKRLVVIARRARLSVVLCVQVGAVRVLAVFAHRRATNATRTLSPSGAEAGVEVAVRVVALALADAH